MKNLKNTLIIFLTAALLISYYMNVNTAEHKAHINTYLITGYTDTVQCDQCAIEISNLILTGKK